VLKKRSIELVEWKDKGKAVGGYLINVTRNKFRDGSTGLTYTVRREDGSLAVFKGAKMLDLALTTYDVGKFIQVVYQGEDETREVRADINRPKLFDVSVDEERTLTPRAPHQDNSSDPGITDEDIPF
jgi:hypothetical protein